jgi:hypothetical protein
MNVAEFTEWIIAKQSVNAKNAADTQISFLKFLLMRAYSH